MAVFRVAIFLLLFVSAGFFAAYALTSKDRYKRVGLTLLIWTLVAAFVFFAILILDRV
ncbi:MULTISPECIES: hypothetical protein [unclassified Polaromonas]|uniref:hypothetical protein n=1 Tax=unclassified Polaromonas TaxID=2638319 RepID=UPI0013DDB9CB|nr:MULTISPECIES: hypothetical protein [unclassified Polaromonas]